MRKRIFFYNAWTVFLAGALVCGIAMNVSAIPDHKRPSSGAYGVEIENFGKVNDHFYRGSQPKGQNYRQLTALGVKTIVDLREDARDTAQSDAERAGMRYINLPLKEKSYPEADAATRFLEILADQTNWPVYVHCAGGRHRTGVMTAVYRMSVDGWSVEQAYQEMKQYDFYTSWGHQCYKDYVFDYYRNLQAQPQRQRVARTRG
jgi:protein tyrosine/serine phosphatase